MDNWMSEFPVHFVSAAGVVFKEDKVLFIRSDRRGWEFPRSLVENGESVLDALKRKYKKKVELWLNLISLREYIRM